MARTKCYTAKPNTKILIKTPFSTACFYHNIIENFGSKCNVVRSQCTDKECEYQHIVIGSLSFLPMERTAQEQFYLETFHLLLQNDPLHQG